MAQLNPNFEIDFSDINSYEQIQLINDTQVAKENLLMHRAYREPSDDAIIQNHFSSFTFVDFCPKIFKKGSSTQPILKGAKLIRNYDLEYFSDLFERINKWLKLNKDWRVVSMETLVFDCKTLFNHFKSSIHSNYLPQNTRGLRLYLSPSKSRFAQKIGCINVVPRKISGSFTDPNEPAQYENLDQILNRLNELLLTRPIEGRILSVETITLPMINGWVDTETTYYFDNRLNLLNQSIYDVTADGQGVAADAQLGDSCPDDPKQADEGRPYNTMVDILRVYYEFGPMICGLVNLIDFIPRFYSPTPTRGSHSGTSTPDNQQVLESNSIIESGADLRPMEKIAATESLTRLIRRSLAWFESERKSILQNSDSLIEFSGLNREELSKNHIEAFDLKCCNLQVNRKIMIKNQLIQVNASNALEKINTRCMAHEKVKLEEPIVCRHCNNSTNDPSHSWCQHLLDLCQHYELKFVRLAYVVPVYNKYVRSSCPMNSIRSIEVRRVDDRETGDTSTSQLALGFTHDMINVLDSSSSSSDSSEPSIRADSPRLIDLADCSMKSIDPLEESLDLEKQSQQTSIAETGNLEKISSNDRNEEQFVKRLALSVVKGTNDRLMEAEIAHQVGAYDEKLNDAPIGQLSYRLFAPCQLVKSSSCFSINPVNSSSPLARRGSLDLNGSGISSDGAHPSTSLLGSAPASNSSTSTRNRSDPRASIIPSFGAIFPALTDDILSGSEEHKIPLFPNNSGKYTGNEFESVDAIRRRMEVYVTTNSMKVIAGETLVVNLSDALSCLTTAIERTIVKAPFAQRTPTTWVSVYILYAAVDEPLLPSHLLANQKLRELHLISEESTNEANEKGEPIFDDDFNGNLNAGTGSKSTPAPVRARVGLNNQRLEEDKSGPSNGDHKSTETQANVASGESSPTSGLYNTAYDRTVALPSPPDNHQLDFESTDMAFDCLWVRDSQLAEEQQERANWQDVSVSRQQSSKRRGRKSRRRHDDSQCSLI